MHSTDQTKYRKAISAQLMNQKWSYDCAKIKENFNFWRKIQAFQFFDEKLKISFFPTIEYFYKSPL